MMAKTGVDVFSRLLVRKGARKGEVEKGMRVGWNGVSPG